MSAPESEYGGGEYGDSGYGGPVIMTKTASVTLALEEQGELTVQVNASDDGAALESVQVSIQNGDGSFSDSGTTDQNGQVVFSGLEVQGYTITATKTGWFEQSASVAPGDFT